MFNVFINHNRVHTLDTPADAYHYARLIEQEKTFEDYRPGKDFVTFQDYTGEMTTEDYANNMAYEIDLLND